MVRNIRKPIKTVWILLNMYFMKKAKCQSFCWWQLNGFVVSNCEENMGNPTENRNDAIKTSTILVLKPTYSGRIGSIPRVMMSRIFVSAIVSNVDEMHDFSLYRGMSKLPAIPLIENWDKCKYVFAFYKYIYISCFLYIFWTTKDNLPAWARLRSTYWLSSMKCMVIKSVP